MAEPESLLARLRKLEAAATPAPWVQEPGSSAFYSLVDDQLLVGDAGSEDREFIVTLRNLAPEIIEAFELLSKVRRLNQPEGRHANLPGVQELVDKTRAKVYGEIDTLLAKVSGQNA